MSVAPLEHALSYARLGFRVLPLRTGDKRPLLKDWPNSASADETVIKGWWGGWPDANVGLLCGQGPGLVVIDVDPRNGGDESLAALEARHNKLPGTIECRTANGGRHLYFRYPVGLVIPSSKNPDGLPGIDMQSDGRQVVAPPSRLENGKAYTWTTAPGNGIEPADLPPEWAQLLTGRQRPAALQPSDDGTTIKEGRRDDTLAKMAGGMRHWGFDEAEIAAALQSANARLCDSPLPESQISKIARSIARYPPEPAVARAFAASPTGRQLSGIESWEPIPASKLGGGEDLPWIWHGYLAPGHVTLLTALWKAGKTTLVAYLTKLLGEGGDLAGRVEPAEVLVVSEESRLLWSQRRDRLDLGDHMAFIFRPFKGRPSLKQWQEFVGHVAGLVRQDGCKVVILDTLASFAPWSDENDAAKVLEVLTPLYEITEAGAALLLVHHVRKGDAGQGQASRGSGALPSFVDIMVELRRHDPTRLTDTRRTLTAYSRFDETPQQRVIELTDEGYRTVGTKADATTRDRQQIIKELLSQESEALTPEDIHKRWPEDTIPKPGIKTIVRDLQAGLEAKLWCRTGEGVKNDPHRYHLASNSILDTTNACPDSNPDDKEAIPDRSTSTGQETQVPGDDGR